ncbi:MFS family permease [Paraburkholderia terricola]|nr:MFS family permease [Paraburkholderia terricola]
MNRLTQAAARRRRRFTLAAVTTLLGAIYAGSPLVTPLYPLYQHAFGLSELTLTLIYAAYMIGNLVALFAFGRLSDQVGRRGVSLAALAVAILSTLLFLLAVDTSWLFAARATSGLAIGVGAATATAWIAELYPPQNKAAASRTAAAVNLAGLTVGPLVAGLLAQFVRWPLRTVFVVYLLVLLGLLACTVFTEDTVTHRARALRDVSFMPRLGVPRNLRIAFVAPVATAFAIFALLGFYAALIPGLLANSMHQHSPAVGGAIVAEVFAVAAGTVIVTRTLQPRTAMSTGLWLLPVSLAMLLWAQITASMAGLVVATALCGISSALGFRGSLQEANEMAPADRRAELVSSYLVACYTGNSLPVVGIAALSRYLGHIGANMVFAAVSVVLAIVALIVSARYRHRSGAPMSRA